MSNLRFETEVEITDPLELCLQRTYDRLLAYGLEPLSSNSVSGSISVQAGNDTLQVPAIVTLVPKEDQQSQSQQVKVRVDILDPPSGRLPRKDCEEIFRKIWEEISLGLLNAKKEVKFRTESISSKSKAVQHSFTKQDVIHIRVNDHCG
jgi:hypothetical protein